MPQAAAAPTRSTRGGSPRVRPAAVLTALVVGPLLGLLLSRPGVLALLTHGNSAFWVTVRVAVPATLLATLFGVAGGYALARGTFPGRDLLEALGSVWIVLPPTVAGYYLIVLLEKKPLVQLNGGPLLFHTPAVVAAAALAAFPFVLRATRAAVEGVDVRSEQVARTLGLPERRVALQVTLPLARRGILAGVTLGAARALGEYGATLFVGGAVAGRTKTLAIAVVDPSTRAQQQAAILVLVALAAAVLGLLIRLERDPA